VHGKATLCRVHGRVTPQLLFQCVLAPCAFTTEELCEKIYRTKHVERKHRIAVMRAATNLAKRRDTKARAAVDGVAEIDRATSYFVGLLGERYGAVPKADAYTAGRLERQPWLEEHRGGKSLTELEILHGVLNNSTRMAGRAHFYFRSREYARKKGGEYPSPDSRECREAGRSQEPDPQERLSDR